MPSSSYCGSVGPLLPSGSVTALLDGQCFIEGLVICLPFALPLVTLLVWGLRTVFKRPSRVRAYTSIQGDFDEEEPPLGSFMQDAESSLTIQTLIHLQWLLSFLLAFTTLLEVGEIITVEHFEWFQLTSALLRIFGVMLCFAIYGLVNTRRPSLGILSINLIVWVLCAATGAMRVQWMIRFHRAAFSLPFVVVATYAGISAALVICDTSLMLLRICGQQQYMKVSTEDLDADPAFAVPPSPAVALSSKDPQLYYLHDDVNFLMRVTFAWLTPLLFEAWRSPIQMSRLGKLPLHDSASENFKGIYRRWKRQQAVKERDAEKASLQWPVWRQFAVPIFVAFLCKQVGDLLAFAGPLSLKGIVQFITDRQQGTYVAPKEVTLDAMLSNGWVLAAGLLVVPVLQSLAQQMYFFVTTRISINVESGVRALVYHKAISLNMETLPSGVTVGSINGHMSVDATAVAELFDFVHYCFTVPTQLLITVYLLYDNIGWAGPTSLLVVLLLLPLQTLIGKLTAAAQKKVLAHNDGRLKLLNELLQGIRIVKFYAWEPLFVNRISSKRNEQLRCLLVRKLWGAGTTIIALTAPSLITVAGFALFTWASSKPLTPGVAFSVLALFNLLRAPMLVLPMAINYWINALVSGKRIVKFLLLPEMDRSFLHCDTDNSPPTAVEVDGTFVWSLDGNQLSKEDSKEDKDQPVEEAKDKPQEGQETGAARIEKFVFQVNVPRGSLLMLVGAVGSGKSTLIKIILGDVPCLTGAVRTHGRIAYVSQQATIFNATLRDNVLFGQPYDTARYEHVIMASGLGPDLDILAKRDETEIGAKGINLSGGQKQRVSIARALYASADIVILDDPLSALDAHVGEHVFTEAVLNMLLAEGKTVIMATHQLQYLKSAHQILLLADGAVKASGTLEELTAAGHDLRAVAIDTSQIEEDTPAEEHSPIAGDASADLAVGLDDAANPSNGGSFASEAESLWVAPQPRTSRLSKLSDAPVEKSTIDAGKLVQEEERAVGAVAWEVYYKYFAACGLGWVTTVVAFQVASKVVNVISDLFLSHWSSQGVVPTPDHSAMWYLMIFTLLNLCAAGVQAVGSIYSAIVSIQGSRTLHHRMLDCVARCPMAFFDTTPLGRIVNRFSNDVDKLDQWLSENLAGVLRTFLNLASALITMVAINPIQAIVLVPVALLYTFLQHFFRCTSRELQRLQNISKSPIFAHLSETLGGVSTIRAYRAVPRFTITNMEHIDRFATSEMYLWTANRWLGVLLDTQGAVIICSTAFFCLAQADTLSPGLAGLSISYALTVVQFVTWFIRTVADAEMMMNSVERIFHYTKLDTEMTSLENFKDNTVTRRRASTVWPGSISGHRVHVVAPSEANGVEVAPDWPSRGAVTIHRLQAAYRPGLPLVLKGISIRIAGGERIGVCGRTGSGKTSLLLALFRMLRLEGGSITVDGVDITKLPLHILRRRMAIIPQDAVLFSGTVRYNLDPAEEHPDVRLWEALRVAQLANVVTGLDQEVLENGENFSMGQRQLFCLARAFLKESRILCLDEATASVDHETDKVIQQLLRSAFVDCTIITIAHRLSTILDYDKVLVLGDGKVLEYDSPNTLLQSETVFKSLVDAANKHTE